MEHTIFEHSMLVLAGLILGTFLGIGPHMIYQVFKRLRHRTEYPVCEWQSLSSSTPDIGMMILGYNKEWICEDFNPNGVRECFLMDDDTWIMSKWNNDQDSWLTIGTDYEGSLGMYIDPVDIIPPTHWCHIPKFKPLKQST